MYAISVLSLAFLYVIKEGCLATDLSLIVLVTCLATIGSVSNPQHQLQVSGKAGRSRWQGRRPNVRATIKNPVDHPMGGGEGKHSGGIPRNKNGVPAKGFKTRNKKKLSDKYIIERRKKK